MNENHPVWGDNVQMSEKRMNVIQDDNDKIILRGFGVDAMGASFAGYGITLHKANGNVDRVTLHMHDRGINIVYKKANENSAQREALDQFSDFDNFKAFTHRWHTGMPMNEKISIAIQTDNINNKGTTAYNDDDLMGAIKYFEQALLIMPNNDDALKNLRLCYSEIGNQSKVKEMEEKLDYLSSI